MSHDTTTDADRALTITSLRGAEVIVDIESTVLCTATIPSMGVRSMPVSCIDRTLSGWSSEHARTVVVELDRATMDRVRAAIQAAPCGHCGGSGSRPYDADGHSVTVPCRACSAGVESREIARGAGWCERCESYCYGDCQEV